MVYVISILNKLYKAKLAFSITKYLDFDIKNEGLNILK